MVPKGWEQKKLEELCPSEAPITYGVLKPGEYFSGGIPLLQIKDLYDGSVLSDGLHLIAHELDYEYRRSRIIKNDILVSLVGTIGRIAKYQHSSEANIHRNIGRIRSNLHEYLFHFLRSEYAQLEIKKSSSGSSQSALNLSTLRSMLILVPPRNEQKKIAKILSTWDSAILVTEKLLTNSQQQKKALMQQLLTGKKRLLDENGVRFSGEWEYTIFGDLGNTYTGLTAKTKEDFGAGKPYIPYINIFKNSRIDTQSLEYVQVHDDERQSVVKYGDIFFTTSSETPDEVGMSSVLLDEVGEVFLNSFCFGFRLNNFETLIPEFARYLFRSEQVRRQISTLGQGATRYNLSKLQLIKLELNHPCVEEQQKIAAVLSSADAEIATLERKLTCLKDEKKALMQQLLTGKRRVVVDADAA